MPSSDYDPSSVLHIHGCASSWWVSAKSGSNRMLTEAPLGLALQTARIYAMFEKSKCVLVSVIALALVLMGVACVSMTAVFFRRPRCMRSYSVHAVGFTEESGIFSTPFVSHVNWRAHMCPPIHSYGVSPCLFVTIPLSHDWFAPFRGRCRYAFCHPSNWSERFWTLDLAIGWSGAAIFDTVIFLMTAIKRVRELAVFEGGLLSVMLRDGEIIFY